MLKYSSCYYSSCGNYMAMIFGDYVAGFLGLQRDGVTGNMTPFEVSWPSRLRKRYTSLTCPSSHSRTRMGCPSAAEMATSAP